MCRGREPVLMDSDMGIRDSSMSTEVLDSVSMDSGLGNRESGDGTGVLGWAMSVVSQDQPRLELKGFELVFLDPN